MAKKATKQNDIDLLKQITCSVNGTSRGTPIIDVDGIVIQGNRISCDETGSKPVAMGVKLEKCTVTALDMGWCWKEETSEAKVKNLEKIARLPKLEELQLKDNRLTAKDVEPLLKATSLKFVGFSPGNRLSSDEMASFIKKLEK